MMKGPQDASLDWYGCSLLRTRSASQVKVRVTTPEFIQLATCSMPTAREGPYLVSRSPTQIPRLGMESSMLKGCVEAVLAQGFRGIFGSPAFGFFEQTLDFLRDLPDIEEIWFWDVKLRNVDAIYALRSLRFFGIHPGRPAINFERIPSLRHITWNYKPGDTGVRELELLDSLHVWHYLPKSKSFSDLSLPSKLTELHINWANPRTLEGIRGVPGLRRLEIHRCRNLESLALVPMLFPQLEHLVVLTCGRIAAGEGERIAAQLPSLKHAFVQNRKVV